MKDLQSFLKHAEALKADAEMKARAAQAMIANLPEPQRSQVATAFDKVVKQEMSINDFITYMNSIIKQ